MRQPFDINYPFAIFSGIGCAQLVVSGLVAIYYNMIIAYSLFYFVASLAKILPWKHCDHDWNTEGEFVLFFFNLSVI